VLDQLKLERVSIIGHSQGGWHALNLAVTAQERVERLVLLSPSGSLGQIRWQFLFHMLPVFVRPTKKNFYRSMQFLTTMPLGEDNALADQFMIGAQAFNPKELSLGVVSVFKDDALRGLKAPTLLLIGEHDGTCKPRRELERARRLIPGLESDLVPGGGHLFPVDQADVVNARLLAFLQE
jgi:pimeloyl-ACP methyl ester carboxylesterase